MQALSRAYLPLGICGCRLVLCVGGRAINLINRRAGCVWFRLALICVKICGCVPSSLFDCKDIMLRVHQLSSDTSLCIYVRVSNGCREILAHKSPWILSLRSDNVRSVQFVWILGRPCALCAAGANQYPFDPHVCCEQCLVLKLCLVFVATALFYVCGCDDWHSTLARLASLLVERILFDFASRLFVYMLILVSLKPPSKK